MKNIILIACALGSTGLFASGGGVTGGWGITNPRVIIGDRVMDPTELSTDSEGNILLEEEQMLEVLKGSMRKERLVVNDEEVKAMHFNFHRGYLTVRSDENPAYMFLLKDKSRSHR